MPGLRRRKTSAVEESDVDMVPIMNMFLVLIPFLLMSASFIHIKTIKTSAPVLSESPNSITETTEKNIKGIVIVELKKEGIHLSLNADALTSKEKDKWAALFTVSATSQYPFTQLSDHLKKIKTTYPASDTLILIPDKEILYDTIIQTMDAARYAEEDIKLFQNVVLSGKVT